MQKLINGFRLAQTNVAGTLACVYQGNRSESLRTESLLIILVSALVLLLFKLSEFGVVAGFGVLQ